MLSAGVAGVHVYSPVADSYRLNIGGRTLVVAALAPSAGTAGMALSMGMWGMAADAMFEPTLQLTGILLSGAVVFSLGNRLAPARRAHPGRTGV